MGHSRWRLAREREPAEGHRGSAEVEQERQEHRLSMALAKVVYDRRVELGLSQSELATRTGLSQAKISRIEGSDTVPTLPLLAKLAKGLNASLNIAIDEDDAQVTLTAHEAA
ncbi:helix-turn-helix domain-containing protein [Streptomyces sp. BRA346]|uniref:helix-turn-helix domain-containing protein n=1 Tax=Streptomyces sp. BRA346 TaxID=2878199 RepID=UPI0040642F30